MVLGDRPRPCDHQLFTAVAKDASFQGAGYQGSPKNIVLSAESIRKPCFSGENLCLLGCLEVSAVKVSQETLNQDFLARLRMVAVWANRCLLLDDTSSTSY